MQVVTVSNDDIKSEISQFSKEVFSHPMYPFNFDMIIGIKNGGTNISRVIKDSYWKHDIKYLEVSVRHQFSVKCEKCQSVIRKLFSLLPYSILDFLRNVDFWKNNIRHVLGLKRPMKSELSLNPNDFTHIANGILIVDDARDSGQTVNEVVRAVREAYASVNNGKNPYIYVFVFNDICNCFCKDVVEKFCIYKDCIVRFPWNLDYKS